MLELREIRIFLALADELHFGHAAERLGVTNSRVSQVIRTLESRVGGRLFDRTSRQVRLTPVGEVLRRRLAAVDVEIQHAYAEAHEMATGVVGSLRLGLPVLSVGGPHLLEIIRTFETRYPECRVVLTEVGFNQKPCDWLRGDDLDLLVIRLPLFEPDVVIGPLVASERRMAAVSTDHPLATRNTISVEDLAEYVTTDITSLPREVMDAVSPPCTPSGRIIQRAPIRSIGEAILRVVNGELVHPTVPSLIDHHSHPRMTLVPIRDLPPIQTALSWLTGRDGPKVKAFVQATIDAVASH